MSIWYVDTLYQPAINSYHWRVKENVSLENHHELNEPDIFTFGSTSLVGQSEIRTLFDDIFESFAARNQKIVVVSHDINSMRSLLKNYWDPPDSVTFLDTGEIARLQYFDSDHCTLERALDITGITKYDKHLLNNAGNDARFTISLLQAQCRRAGQFERQVQT